MIRSALRPARTHLRPDREAWDDLFDFVPTDISGLSLWLRSDLGVTIVQSPVTATGTTPPTVTLTGSPPNTRANTIVISITLLGALGTAQFSWSLNGVVQQTGQVTSASFPLAGTGLTAVFSAGTYAINDVYTSVLNISAWADQSGNGNNATQATGALQPTFGNLGGQSSLLFSGSQYLNLPTIAAGAGGALSLALICKLTSAPGASTSYTGLSVRSTGTTCTPIDFLNQAGYQNFSVLANSVSSASAAVGFNPTLDTSAHAWVVAFAGGTITTPGNYAISMDGTVETVVASSNLGIANTATGAIGGFVASGPVLTNGCPFTVAEVIMYTVQLSAAQMARLNAYALARYGV
jgi:hypothetical protein